MTSQRKRITPLAANVKAARARLKISQHELANRAQVSLSTVTRLEQGLTRLPRENEFERIATALGSTAEELERPSGSGASSSAVPRVFLDAPADDLSRKVHEAFGGNAQQIEDFFLQCGDLSDHDRDFVLATVSWLKGRIAAANAYERTRAAMRAGATMHQDDPVLSK